MIRLSDRFDYKRLLKFTFSSIVMIVLTSVYGVVDGYFVSNFAGKGPFAAINFIMPFLMIIGSVGFMFGTGGGALVAKIMGEGDSGKANRIFSMLVYLTILSGLVLGGLGWFIIRPFAGWLGAEGQLLEDCVVYGRIVLAAMPFYVLTWEFQCLFVTAEKPKLGLYVTILSGLANIVLDAVLVAGFHMGLVGAAIATAICQAIGGVLPIIYFARPNTSRLHLGKAVFDGKAILQTCWNGSSELLNTVSSSIVGMIYNAQLLRYIGEDGVAAFGVLMYVNLIVTSIFIGYAVGVAPVISYHFGAQNHPELRSLLRKSLIVVSVWAGIVVLVSLLFAKPLATFFVGYDPALMEMTSHAFLIFVWSFLFCGFAIFGSSFFTDLNDGLTSSLISCARTLVFQIGTVLLFPLLWGVDGIWGSLVVSEALSVIVAFFFLRAKQARYGY